MKKNRFEKRIIITPEVLNKISEIDRIKGEWRGGLSLSPQILGRLKASVIITSSGSSTRIEGARLSDAEVDRLLRGLNSKKPKDRDEQEVAGYADLLSRIFENHTSLKLTENNILNFHNILLKFSEKDAAHRGRYKTTDNKVIIKGGNGKASVLFETTKPYLVRPEMEAVLGWTEQNLIENNWHPILVVANFIFEFLATHPFIDGNGRLSRALTNLLLLRAGYSYVPYVSLDEIIEETKDKYYLSLHEAQEHHKTANEDISSWLNYFLDSMLEQAKRAIDIMGEAQPEKLLSEKQANILNLFSDEGALAVSDINRKLKGKMPMVSIKQALSRLASLKLIEKIGQGRATRYRKL